jgi:Na+/H+ antiporter NhaD/arsenite permease-like protein
MEGALIPIIVFAVVYFLLTFELVNKAVAALGGVLVLIVLSSLGVPHGAVGEGGRAAVRSISLFGFEITLPSLTEEIVVGFIDFETIMLLLGMMIIVSLIRRSGFFTLLSVKIAEMTRGSPLKILVMFSVITAVMSSLLDNVTTVLIIIPIVIELTAGMGLDPRIYVISLALMSNIGGTATLIGDPPNIIIGSKVGLTFNQFLINLLIPVVIAFTIGVFYMWFFNKRAFKPINTNLLKLFTVQLLLEKIRFELLNIKLDKDLMYKSLGCLALAVFLFVTQTITHLTPGVVAMFVAMLLFIVSGYDLEQILEEIEWSTILFFVGLFILVGTLEHYRVIQWIAENAFMKVGTNPYVIVLMVLWVSGIASGFLDNIPFTMTMIPIVYLLLEASPIPNNILWWSLALGACFGGNITMIGASANIVSVGIARKHRVDISFLEFMKSGAMISLMSLTVASIYLALFLWLSL